MLRLWTIQDKAAYDDFLNKGVLQCHPSLAMWLNEESFKRSYDWLVTQMCKRIDSPPEGVSYPIWAWYLIHGQNVKPDLRRYEFRNYVGENYIIEAEIPDSEVLLSDEEMWHIVLNNGYFSVYEREAEWSADYDWFDSLPLEEQSSVKLSSWERIFDQTYCPWMHVQASFWSLRKENVVSVRRFLGRQQPVLIASVK
ncbi:hypothetical protein AGMMS49992_25300 [Clostridia bacterium]|nr:hypothetical protein AGMMS49992_25300 [Clostridia bacterium]